MSYTPNSDEAQTTLRNNTPLGKIEEQEPEPALPPKDHRFWAVILATCVSVFLSALDLVCSSPFDQLAFNTLLTLLDRIIDSAANYRQGPQIE
jgi:hypothetical protein